MREACFIFFALVCVCEGLQSGSRVTPVQKVIDMLQEMLEKGKKDKEEESVMYSAFSQFCEDTSADKGREIEMQQTRIETLNADIEKLSADAMMLGKEVGALSADVGSWTADRKKATEIREKENADFLAMHKDYSESTDALERAIQVMKTKDFDRPQALMQMKGLVSMPRISSSLPIKAKRVITSFLSMGLSRGSDDVMYSSPPEAHGYEFQSGGIIEMLEKLLDKFIEERHTLEIEEANSRHAYELLVQDIGAQVGQANKVIDKKSKIVSLKKSKAGQYRSELNGVEESKASDEKYLSELKSECSLKASDFTERQKLRAEEIEALTQGLEILQSSELQAAATRYLPQLLQKRIGHPKLANIQLHSSSPSFLQTKEAVRHNGASIFQISSFLAGRGNKLESPLLKLLADTVTKTQKEETALPGGDPFTKVRNMIQDLIFRLQQKAVEEADHKGWCDKELAENEGIRSSKKEDVDRLRATTDQIAADIAKLKQDQSDLEGCINELQTALATSTKQRIEEKKRNELTIADAKKSQSAITSALTILREFYTKAAPAAPALVQLRRSAQPAPPLIWDSAYTGQQGAKGGVIGMLEVIQTDFARLESETSAAENSALRNYDQFKHNTEKDVAVKKATVFHTQQMTVNQESALSNTQRDLEATSREYEAALDYFQQLKASCINTGVTFEERTARREEEIQSLKEALRILSGEASGDLAA